MIVAVLLTLSATIKRASVIDGCTSASKIKRPLLAFKRSASFRSASAGIEMLPFLQTLRGRNFRCADLVQRT